MVGAGGGGEGGLGDLTGSAGGEGGDGGGGVGTLSTTGSGGGVGTLGGGVGTRTDGSTLEVGFGVGDTLLEACDLGDGFVDDLTCTFGGERFSETVRLLPRLRLSLILKIIFFTN